MAKAQLLTDILHSSSPLLRELGACRSALSWQPPADVTLSAERASIRFELAGISRDHLRLIINGSTVHLTGHRPPPVPVGGAGFGYERAEILYGAFERRIDLPWLVDPQPLTIDYYNGLLLIELRRQLVDPSAPGAGDRGGGAS